MNTISYRILTDIKQAEMAWKALSPNHSIYNNWEFRKTYYKYFNFPLRFYAAFEGTKLVALFPLMWNEDAGQLEFFACFDYMKNNTIFTLPGYEDLKEALFFQIDEPLILQNMHRDMLFLPQAEEQKSVYFADLSKLTNYEDFLTTYLSHDGRKNLRSQIKKIHESAETITIGHDEDDDLPLLFAYNKARFGETSKFVAKPFWESFFTDLSQSFETHTISISLNGEKKAVGLVLFYNDTSYGLNSGYDISVSNLGKYLTLQKIEFAIKNGKKIYDAGAYSYNWKEDFHLLKTPQYSLDMRSTQPGAFTSFETV